MKNTKVLFLLLCIISIETNAQDNESVYSNRTEFKIGYSGTILWSNGINVGAEYLFKEVKKNKERTGAQRTNTHQFLFNGNIGFATNFATKTGTGGFTNFGITWRRTNKNGEQFNIDINPIGYYRSFLPETYEVQGDNVDKVTLPGRGYYSPAISVGIGTQRKGKVRSATYLSVTYGPRFNYNAGTLPTFSIQYGFRFNFKNKKNKK